MRLSECLEQEIFDAGMKKRRMELTGSLEGMLVGSTVITDSSLDPLRDNCITCHELEHKRTEPKNLMYAPEDLRRKVEAGVNRRTVLRLVPIEALVFLFKSGARQAEEFADALEIDGEFFCRAMELYEGIYGGSCVKNGCVITFSPFSIERNAGGCIKKTQ